MQSANRFSGRTSDALPGTIQISVIYHIKYPDHSRPTRLHYIKKLTKRQQKDVVLIKSRLDLYNDNWRTANPSTKIRRVTKKIKLPSKSTTSGANTPTAPPAISTASTLRVPTNGGGAAPITKRKRSSTTKRQSVSSRTNPELWKSHSYSMDDWCGSLDSSVKKGKPGKGTDYNVMQ